jgi:hypothetical protein
LKTGDFNKLAEEVDGRFRHAPVVGGRNQVGRQVELADEGPARRVWFPAIPTK